MSFAVKPVFLTSNMPSKTPKRLTSLHLEHASLLDLSTILQLCPNLRSLELDRVAQAHLVAEAKTLPVVEQLEELKLWTSCAQTVSCLLEACLKLTRLQLNLDLTVCGASAASQLACFKAVHARCSGLMHLTWFNASTCALQQFASLPLLESLYLSFGHSCDTVWTVELPALQRLSVHFRNESVRKISIRGSLPLLSALYCTAAEIDISTWPSMPLLHTLKLNSKGLLVLDNLVQRCPRLFCLELGGYLQLQEPAWVHNHLWSVSLNELRGNYLRLVDFLPNVAHLLLDKCDSSLDLVARMADDKAVLSNLRWFSVSGSVRGSAWKKLRLKLLALSECRPHLTVSGNDSTSLSDSSSDELEDSAD